jgi:hypothetical protein
MCARHQPDAQIVEIDMQSGSRKVCVTKRLYDLAPGVKPQDDQKFSIFVKTVLV